MRLVLLGPPGIGKGTQAGILVKTFSIVHLSTGEILRSEMTRETRLGRLAMTFIDLGKLVPDDIMLNIVSLRLKEEDVQKGYILDGFPRTVAQAKGLDSLLKDLAQTLDAVIALEGNEEIVMERLSKRGRPDDRPDVIRHRLRVYRKQTEPLVDYYRRASLLKSVDGTGTIEQVTANIMKALS